MREAGRDMRGKECTAQASAPTLPRKMSMSPMTLTATTRNAFMTSSLTACIAEVQYPVPCTATMM